MSNYRNSAMLVGAIALGYAIRKIVTLPDNEKSIREHQARGYAQDAENFGCYDSEIDKYVEQKIELQYALSAARILH